jgi:hypothetical protein
MTYMRSWKSLRLTSHTWLGLNPQIGRPLSRIVVPLIYYFYFHFITVFTVFTVFYLTNLSDWGCLSMFMDGRFIIMARISFEIIVSDKTLKKIKKVFRKNIFWKFHDNCQSLWKVQAQNKLWKKNLSTSKSSKKLFEWCSITIFWRILK